MATSVRGGGSAGVRAKSCGLTAEMSAGKTDVTVEPFAVVICIMIVGADSAEVTCLRANILLGTVSVVTGFSGGTCIAFALEVAGGCVGDHTWYAQHTLAICPVLLQWWQVLS